MEAGTQSNLGKIIKDIVINQKFERVQDIYIVDKQTGPYRNIQQAVDEATPGALIKISEGIYNQVLHIKKPLTLEPKIYNVSSTKESAGVVLLVSAGIAIQVQIPEPQGTCKIRGIKISHSANVKVESYQNDIIDNEEIFGLLNKNKNNTYSLDCQYVNKVKPENMQNMIVWVKSGKLILQSSLLSLSFIVKSCNAIVPAVFVNKNAKIVMTRCEVRGNAQHQTVGVISKQGSIELNSCRFSQHKRGAILLWGTANNDSMIVHTNIQDSDIGIHVVGEQNNVIIKRTIITKCRLGIKVGLAVMCEIINNYIMDNETGIQVYSAFPIVTKNRIEKNKENGIGLYSYKKMICQAVIRSNHSIVGNKLNGIVVQGISNYSKIMENTLIGFNGKAGIRIANEAHPHILLNKIHKNIEHGILVIENSSATIEKNEINCNVKMNIGLGGYKSNNTTIMQNRIKGSKGEGIFMVECCGASILRNDILENNDGIVALSSNAIVNKNFISKNRGNGVLLLKQANLELSENFISENEAVGVYFRDKSYGVVESNIVDGNQIDINLQKLDKRHSQIATMNTVDGEIRVPRSTGCLLF